MAKMGFDTVTVTLDRQTAQEAAVVLWGMTQLLENIPPNDTSDTVERLRDAVFILAHATCALPHDYFASWERMP